MHHPVHRVGKAKSGRSKSRVSREARVLAVCATLAICWGFHSWSRLQGGAVSKGPLTKGVTPVKAADQMAKEAGATAQQQEKNKVRPDERSALATDAQSALKTDEVAAPKPSTPPHQLHRILLLDSPTRQLTEAELGLSIFRRHPQAFSIVRVAADAAGALAPTFGVDPLQLPVVIYSPPHFIHGKRHYIFDPAHAKSPAEFFGYFRTVAHEYLEFGNDASKEVCYYWVSPDVNVGEVEMVCLQPRGRQWEQTSVLDKFVARDKETGDLMGEKTILYPGVFAVRNKGECDYQQDANCEIRKEPYPTDKRILNARKQSNENRIWENTGNNPNVKHYKNYTKAGFEKRRAPEEVMQTLYSYMQVNNGSWVREDMDPEFIFINQFEAPTMSMPVPDGFADGTNPLKDRVFGIMQKILEEWSGIKLLRHTAMYGIRVYTDKSLLLGHLDRSDTHIISAIIQVDQWVEQPWQLNIVDHDNKMHWVSMAQGDMVMYEGSTCIHGREKAMKGRYYANLFVHFQPAT